MAMEGRGYQELKVIGKGSQGTVTLVRHRGRQQSYVVKKIVLDALTDQEQRNALQECDLLKKLRHPNIVEYIESFIEEEEEKNVPKIFIVMQYCSGGDLSSLIKARERAGGAPFDEGHILDWFVQVAMAVGHIHEQRILHRDLKTNNVFLTDKNIVKLGDFGIARVLDTTMEQAETVIGTPYYMSPEVCENRPYSYASDIWALGCILYELCALRHAFKASNLLGIVFKIVAQEAPPIPAVFSQQMVHLVEALLRKKSEERPSVADVLTQLYIRRHIRAMSASGGSFSSGGAALAGNTAGIAAAEDIASASGGIGIRPPPGRSSVGSSIDALSSAGNGSGAALSPAAAALSGSGRALTASIEDNDRSSLGRVKMRKELLQRQRDEEYRLKLEATRDERQQDKQRALLMGRKQFEPTSSPGGRPLTPGLPTPTRAPGGYGAGYNGYNGGNGGHNRPRSQEQPVSRLNAPSSLRPAGSSGSRRSFDCGANYGSSPSRSDTTALDAYDGFGDSKEFGELPRSAPAGCSRYVGSGSGGGGGSSSGRRYGSVSEDALDISPSFDAHRRFFSEPKDKGMILPRHHQRPNSGPAAMDRPRLPSGGSGNGHHHHHGGGGGDGGAWAREYSDRCDVEESLDSDSKHFAIPAANGAASNGNGKAATPSRRLGVRELTPRRSSGASSAGGGGGGGTAASRGSAGADGPLGPPPGGVGGMLVASGGPRTPLRPSSEQLDDRPITASGRYSWEMDAAKKLPAAAAANSSAAPPRRRSHLAGEDDAYSDDFDSERSSESGGEGRRRGEMRPNSGGSVVTAAAGAFSAGGGSGSGHGLGRLEAMERDLRHESDVAAMMATMREVCSGRRIYHAPQESKGERPGSGSGSGNGSSAGNGNVAGSGNGVGAAARARREIAATGNRLRASLGERVYEEVYQLVRAAHRRDEKVSEAQLLSLVGGDRRKLRKALQVDQLAYLEDVGAA